MRSPLPPRVVRGAASGLATATLVAGLASCSGGGADSEPSGPPDGSADPVVVSADQVGGEQTGEGARLLEPATTTCAADGSFLWADAEDGDVRSFAREVDGTREDVVVGAWPMSRAAAEDALARIELGPGCQSDTVRVMSASIGYVIGADEQSSFEVRRRDAAGDLTWWQIRAYAWADGYLMAVWSTRVGSEPSRDAVAEVLNAQIEAASRG